jgi:hypothetical protein
VLTLSLPSGPDNRAGQAWTRLGNVSRNWRAEFEPLSANLGLLLGDVQLGYSLLACVALGVLVPGARRASAFLLGCILCLLVLLVPVPGLTGWLWSRVPHAVLDVTNAWPMQRLYPLCAGLAVFASWAGLSQLSLGRRRRVALLAAAMAVALAWSACEAQKLIRRAELSQRSSAQSAILFAPGNIMLSRVSYMFFGRLPGYFTNGPMDADLETRLLDERTAAVLADGTSVLGGRAAGQGRTAEMTAMGFGIAQARFPVLPMESDILRFDFLGRRPAGELQVTSRTMYGLYALPSSGSEKSFGAEARSSRKIEVRNDSDRADTVSVTFVPNATPGGWTGDSGPFARFTVEPLSRAGRVIEVRSLLPFSATVHSDREAVLETPKMVVPDYRAVVDGREVEIVPTQDGLVGVPVPAGTSDVQVAYAGGRALRWAYRVSGFSWLGLAIATAGLPFVRRQGAPWARLAAAGNFISSRVAPAFVVAGVVAALVVGAPRLWRLKVAPEPAGRRLVVMLPLGRDGASEPLIATGRTGAADVIFVNFLGGNRVSVGYDKWGVGASVSAPFEVSIAKPQTIDVSMASLARRGLWGIGGPPEAPRGVTVRWNGREVLSTARSPYPRGSDPVEIGANAVGASTCGAAFTGTVLSVSGIPSRSP